MTCIKYNWIFIYTFVNYINVLQQNHFRNAGNAIMNSYELLWNVSRNMSRDKEICLKRLVSDITVQSTVTSIGAFSSVWYHMSIVVVFVKKKDLQCLIMPATPVGAIASNLWGRFWRRPKYASTIVSAFPSTAALTLPKFPSRP